jgi:hypothetical protein
MHFHKASVEVSRTYASTLKEILVQERTGSQGWRRSVHH